MSNYRAIYAARRAAGRCVSCGGARTADHVRCRSCAKKHREQNRDDYAKRPVGWQQTRDLAEFQAFKKGGAVLAKDDAWPSAEPALDLRFIRAQGPQAVPLLAKLFSVSEDKIRSIRGEGKGDRSQQMPLKLLKELVEQRTGKYYIDHFIVGKSSVVECEEA